MEESTIADLKVSATSEVESCGSVALAGMSCYILEIKFNSGTECFQALQGHAGKLYFFFSLFVLFDEYLGCSIYISV